MLSKLKDKWKGNLSRVNTVDHQIDFTSSDVRPLHSAPYWSRPCVYNFERDWIDKKLKTTAIEPVQTECPVLIVLTQMINETLQLCVGNRKCNAITVRHSYPLLRVDKCIDGLGRARVFSTLGASS